MYCISFSIVMYCISFVMYCISFSIVMYCISFFIVMYLFLSLDVSLSLSLCISFSNVMYLFLYRYVSFLSLCISFYIVMYLFSLSLSLSLLLCIYFSIVLYLMYLYFYHSVSLFISPWAMGPLAFAPRPAWGWHPADERRVGSRGTRRAASWPAVRSTPGTRRWRRRCAPPSLGASR